MKKTLYRVFLLLIVVTLSYEFYRWKVAQTADVSEVVNVYSSRKEELMRDLFSQFEESTGIKVNVVIDKAPKLLERMISEGENSPVDVLLTSDIGNLSKAKKLGVLQAVQSEKLAANIPANLRDEEGFWFALSKRIRAVFYKRGKVSPEEITRYEDLADPKWKGRLLVRSSSNIYNQSLVAWMLERKGEEQTKQWLDGLVANFARKPQGGDTDQLRALIAGEGDVAIANSYYYARLLASADRKEGILASSIGVVFPGQEEQGAHANISGGAIAAHSQNKDAAVRLLEFLSEARAQKVYATRNYEYPVLEGLPLPDALKLFGRFTSDDDALLAFVDDLDRALVMAKEAGWR